MEMLTSEQHAIVQLHNHGECIVEADKDRVWFYDTGADTPLSREEVAELVKHLQAWLDTGSLEVKADG